MKFLKVTAAAALALLPILVQAPAAQAATASQYSARGHGRQPMMSNRPSRANYHQHRMRHRRH